jgi:putative cardiolipin synthase
MHNKLMVADGERAIFGGRNVGDEYFGLSDGFNFVDFDALYSGWAVADFAALFEAYWNGPVAVSGANLNESVYQADLVATRELVAAELDRHLPALSGVLAAQAASDRLHAEYVPLDAGSIRVVFDAVAGAHAEQPTQVVEALAATAEEATTELIIVTPFFVPDELDMDWYRAATSRGVRVRLLTNSLASNPGTISNSGLKRQREVLLRAGVELHELRTDAAVKPEWETDPQSGRYLGLHAKLYVVDRRTVFVGSLNLDPRSMLINTETGVVIDSAELAKETAAVARRLMASENSWRVSIGPDGNLRWTSDAETRASQPARHTGQRLADLILGWLPIRDQI